MLVETRLRSRWGTEPLDQSLMNMPEAHALRGAVSMQKYPHISAFSSPNFAIRHPSSAVQSRRGVIFAGPGTLPNGLRGGFLLHQGCKEASGVGKRIGHSSWLLALLTAVLLIASRPMAAQGSPSVGFGGRVLKTLLKEALNSNDPCTALADAAKNGGVRVLAVDFDMTMITAHSGKCSHARNC